MSRGGPEGKVGAYLGSHLLASRAKAAGEIWLRLILLTNRQERVRESGLDPSAPLIDIRHVECGDDRSE